MAEFLRGQPNYTCTETIERTRQAPASRAKVEDTLRLEGALVDGKEMFAWPGSARRRICPMRCFPAAAWVGPRPR